MFNPFLQRSLLKSLFLPILLIGMATLLQACGGEEEAQPELAIAEPVAEPKVIVPEDTPPPPPGLEMGEVVPQTLSVLQFMPEEAQIALAFPAVPGIRDKAMPLLRVMATQEDIDEELAEAVFDMGDEIGIQAETFEELADALGVDAEGPLAIFADFSPVVASALAAKAAAEPSGQTEHSTAEGDVSSADDDTGSPTDDEEEGGDEIDYFDDADEPAWVGVLTLADPAKARAEMARIVEEDEELNALEKSVETIGDVEVTIHGDYGYIATEKHMILGEANLVRSAARRVNDPATFRYGTVECPAAASDEISMLVYGSRFMPLLDEAMPVIMAQGDDTALAIVQSQMDLYKGMFGQGEDEDPIVGTMSWIDDQLEVLTRADTMHNPGMLEASGEALPLRLARYLPENTLGMVSLRFNDAFKEQLMNSIMPAVAAGGSGTDVAMVGQIIPQIGDELTLGITDVDDGELGIYLMLGLAQPETTQGILQMFVPMDGGVEHQGYTINNVPAPSPMPIYMSFVDDFALAGTSQAGLKSIIDRHASKGVSGAFAAMDPPFDIDLPRYQAINLNTQLLGASLTAMVESFGGDLGESGPIVHRVSKVLREVRSAAELDGSWMNGRFMVYFNDLEAAALESPEEEEDTESPSAL